jgi:hypothetical protein
LLRPPSGIKAPQQEKFYEKAYSRHNQGSQDGGHIETYDWDEQELPDGIREKGPQHVEGAVCKIEDPQDTEGERKARGDQKEQCAPGDSTHELVEENVKRHNHPNNKSQITNLKSQINPKYQILNPEKFI